MNCKKLHYNKIGFSLIELLTVVAITAMLMTLAIPTISGFTSPAGRKGAVTIVMNTLEQARVSAIETGRETAVLFWKKNGASPSQPDEPDAMMVLRRNEADDAWESTTRWIKLPTGVLFHGENSGSAILTSNMTLTLPSLPGNPASTQLRALHFTSSGAVKSPSGLSTGLYIAFTEGQRDTGGSVVVKKQKNGGQEVISLARYTGRSTMDIVELP
jgi:prepilin-type N-terminal cleavage/methylation domain-containing protein